MPDGLLSRRVHLRYNLGFALVAEACPDVAIAVPEGEPPPVAMILTAADGTREVVILDAGGQDAILESLADTRRRAVGESRLLVPASAAL